MMTLQRIAVILATVTALTACAGAPTTALRPVTPGTSINVDVVLPEIETPNALNAGESTGRYMGGGSAYGAVAGLQLSVEGCGPLFFACAPFAVPAGAVVGAVAGGTYGAAVALPAEKARALESIVSDYVATADISDDLRQEFLRQQAGRWVTNDDVAEVTVTLGIERLRFEQSTGDELLIRLTSNLVVQYGPDGNNVTKRILLNAETGKHHIDYWIDNDGANTRAGLAEVFAENSRQIVAVLSQPVKQR